jgi:hypothetical protein
MSILNKTKRIKVARTFFLKYTTLQNAQFIFAFNQLIFLNFFLLSQEFVSRHISANKIINQVAFFFRFSASEMTDTNFFSISFFSTWVLMLCF